MAGTSDGKELAASLQEKGFPVLVTVTSTYGEALAVEQGLQVHTGPLDVDALLALIAGKGVSLLVDATHPYAVQASITAMEAAQTASIPYFRYERPVSTGAGAFMRSFSNIEELCRAVGAEEGNVLLTLGSNHLHLFADLPNRDNLYIRMLPIPALIEKCLSLGFRSDRILAMQGPFSEAFNEALIRQWHISVLVTKDSAGPGGFTEKLEAARSTGIRLFLLNRPAIVYTEVCESVEDLINQVSIIFNHRE